jgi:hypothetical protein
LCAMLRLMPLFCSSDRSELQYLITSTIPLTTAPHSLKDSFDFGGAVDTEGGKLSVSVQFSRPVSRVSARVSPSIAPLSSAPTAAASHAFGSSSTAASSAVRTSALPPTPPLDSRDPKTSPPVSMLPPKRHSLTPGSAPETAPISSGRRSSLQPSPSPVGSLEGSVGFGGGSRIFTPAVTVRYASSGQPASSGASASAVRTQSASSSQHVEHMGQLQLPAVVHGAMTGPSPPQCVVPLVCLVQLLIRPSLLIFAGAGTPWPAA